MNELRCLVVFTSILLSYADYIPSFHGNNDDDVYNARFRYVPCSICYRNQIITNPDFVLPINTAGVLQSSSASCAQADQMAANGSFSQAACILLRSRVLDVCGCAYPTTAPTSSPPVSTTVKLRLDGVSSSTLDASNQALFERVCAEFLAQHVGSSDVNGLQCRIATPQQRRLLRRLEELILEIIIEGNTSIPPEEFEILVAEALKENEDALVGELQEEAPAYFGDLESVALEPIGDTTEDGIDRTAPTVTAPRKIGPFSIGGFSVLVVVVTIILVLLIGFTYLAGHHGAHAGQKGRDEKVDKHNEEDDEGEINMMPPPPQLVSSETTDNSAANLLKTNSSLRRTYADDLLADSDDDYDNGSSSTANVVGFSSDTSGLGGETTGAADTSSDDKSPVGSRISSPVMMSSGELASSPNEIEGPFFPSGSLTEMEGFSVHAADEEVEVGEDETDSYAESSEESDVFPMPSVSRTVIAPPGKLGIVIDTTINGPVVHRVNPKSPLLGLLSRGDVIVAVDDVDTRDMSASAITALMVRTSGVRRTLTVMGADDAAAELNE